MIPETVLNIMRCSALLVLGLCAASVFGFTPNGGDAERAQAAKARLAALPRISVETWKGLLAQHGWLVGNSTSKIKIVGILTPEAPLAARNLLFGTPNRDADFVCKTMMLPMDGCPNWNMATRLRVAYALMEPNKYKTPSIILNQKKQIAEPKPGEFAKAWDEVPKDIQDMADAEVAKYGELAKHVKINTYYAILPNDEVVEVGHPFQIEAVWNDYLSAKAN